MLLYFAFGWIWKWFRVKLSEVVICQPIMYIPNIYLEPWILGLDYLGVDNEKCLSWDHMWL